MKTLIDDLQFDDRGLLPAIIQDAETKEVLTLAYMNAESLRRTLAEGETWFWSRSRQELWHKGATSGNTQRVLDVRPDCDNDAVVVLVEPAGPACHTGEQSCFFNALEGFEPTVHKTTASDLGSVIQDLYGVVESRKLERPEGSYTTYLFEKGLDKILKKVGEESAETIIAAKNAEAEPLISETSDLLYHLLVMLVERGITLDQIGVELNRRAGGGQNAN
jgi:phosphoribosyl-ATP pyrophosphohydrolase/phosphoribosyl-AMP cyclohydrolase